MPNTELQFSLNNVAKAYRIFEMAVAKDNNDCSNGIESNEAEDMLNMLIPALTDAERPLIGDADDYHNFSVSILKKFDEYGIALTVINMGLEAYSLNTDLLSDSIRYASNCNRMDIADKSYAVLKSIDKSKWTWRAFSFSIDYLLDRYLQGTLSDLTEALDLVKDYQAYFPYEEDAWKCEQDIYTKTNQRSKGIEVLETAIKKFKFCPRCWLRYADFMMDDGEFEKAGPIIKKLCINPLSAEHVNMAYAFYLDGLCKMTAWQNSEDYQEGIYNKETVDSIYRCFRKALKHTDCRPNLEEKINNLACTIYQETEYPSGIEGIDKAP